MALHNDPMQRKDRYDIGRQAGRQAGRTLGAIPHNEKQIMKRKGSYATR